MSLSQKNVAFLLVFAAAVCVELYQGMHIVGRCKCPKVQNVSRINVLDFEVIEITPGCSKVEVILTAIKSDNSTDQICVDTKATIAKNFMKCWERMNKDASRKMECVEKRRRAEKRSSQRTEGQDELKAELFF